MIEKLNKIVQVCNDVMAYYNRMTRAVLKRLFFFLRNKQSSAAFLVPNTHVH